MPKLAPGQRTPTDKTAQPTQLSERDRRFVEAFMGAAAGNASEAVRLTGYRGKHASVVGSQYLAKLSVQAAIAERQASDPAIMDRRERQMRLTAIARSPEEATSNILRAIDQSSKIGGDYIDRHELTGKDGGPIKVEERQVIHQHFPGGLPNA